MSAVMTNRQKLIRLGASAIVCGLSVSFALGEMVDKQAKRLSSWSTDVRIFPSEYSYVLPLKSAMTIAKDDSWKNAWVAANSIAAPNIIDKQGDKISVASAAPISLQRSHKLPPMKQINKKIQRNTQKQAATQEASAAELQKVLADIYSTSAKIAMQLEVKATSKDAYAVAHKTIRTKEAPIEEGLGQVLSSEPVRTATENKTAVKKNDEAWSIAGAVTGKQLNGEGHIEVSLFSQIDSTGKPIGFPIVQQILPAGQVDYALQIPRAVQKGYLFGEFVSSRSGKRAWIAPVENPVSRAHANRPIELSWREQQDKVISIASASVRGTWKINGHVTTMFAKENEIAQTDVLVRLRGRKEATRTDKDGNFSLSVSAEKGTVYIELIKAGYHPVILPVPAGEDISLPNIELANRDAIEKIAISLGIRQMSNKGIFIGKAIGVDGKALSGFSASLSLKAQGPFYFSKGYPSADFKGTTEDGRFIFFNVESGIGLAEFIDAGEVVAPMRVSLVEGGELLYRTLTPVYARVKGRVFNPVTSKNGLLPIAGAKVRVSGLGEWSNTDSYGAFSIGPMKFIKGEAINIELSSARFYNHSYNVQWKKLNNTNLNLYAFPADYINKLAGAVDISLNPYAGIIIGKVTDMAVRMDALADHVSINTAKDFYFDARGRLRGFHRMTDPKFGTYIIFNVPRGRSILQGNDTSGKLLYSEASAIQASTINVVMD